jgi:SAM-dependent methyltransferase
LRSGPIDTLDAGFGNGALSYAAYRRGNRVLGVTIDPSQIQKASDYYSFIKVDQARLQFKLCNLYDLPQLNQTFDQIICSETLEHIARDQLVVQHFYNLLKEGGVLHLCCPFSDHPSNRGRLDERNHWHVRDGYTMESYRALLEPVGFQIVRSVGLGSPLLVKITNVTQSLWARKGIVAALPVFLLTWPLQFFDYLNPRVPISLYVQAVKKS